MPPSPLRFRVRSSTPTPSNGGRGISGLNRLIGLIVAGLLVALAVAGPSLGGLSPEQLRAGALTVGAVSLWALGSFPIGLTAGGLICAALLTGFAPAIVFSGLSSSAFWIVVGGILIGIAIRHTGLGPRVARSLASAISGSYIRILAGTAITALAFSMLMPSAMGRVLLLIPMVLSVADRFGFLPGRPGRTGMVLVATTVGFMPAGSILTALVPNLVLAGAAENLYGLRLQYSEYLLINFPVMGFGRTVAIVVLAAWLFRDHPGTATPSALGERMSPRERTLAVALGVTLVAWWTDGWHGLAPAWPAIVVAAFVAVPGLRLVPSDWPRRIDFDSVFYTAAVLAIGAMVSSTGFAEHAGTWLTQYVPFRPGADFINMLQLTALAAGLGLVVTNPGVPAVLGPLAGQLAETTGLSIQVVLMSQVAGFSNVILPYQAAPVLVGVVIGGLRLRDASVLLACVTGVTFALLLPLEYVWWRWLAII